MSKELYRKYRPKTLDEVVGQESAVSVLTRMIKSDRVPHSILFVGPSGCGKTTLARIMRKKVGCGLQDFDEVNCADFRGIDMVRSIGSQMNLAPMSGRSKVWLIDECQKLTSDGQAAMLKMLEDTPDHVYFFLATTDPQKLLPTIRTRCTEIKVSLLSSEVTVSLLKDVSKKEGMKLVSLDVFDMIAEKAEGSARKALVLFHQVLGLSSEKEQIAALAKADTKTQAIQLARLLITPKPNWNEVAKILKNLDDEPETVRRIMLGYAGSVLLGNGKLAKRALFLIDVFGSNFYDSGQAGLIAACYAVSTG